MANDRHAVADGMVVGFDYTLRLEDGEVIDSSEEVEPLVYLHGQGDIIPGLERALYGMRAGEERNVVLEPADAYGEFDPEAVEFIPYDALPEDLEMELGMELELHDEDTEEVYTAYVTEIRPDGVMIDMNHPLAGETLYFQVKIAEVRLATPEELEHGHVHDSDHEH